ncbi:MAG TPA: outer membrane beta-barrel protein [Candidatus Binataceae bacterium]
MQPKTFCSAPTTSVGNRLIRIFFAVTFLVSSFCHAQVQAGKQSANSDSEPSENKVTKADSNAALLQELEAMRMRIEQLEAQLKAQSSTKGDVATTDTAGQLQAARQSMVAAGSAPVASPVTPTSATAVEAATATPTTPASPAKAAPFAFADFTWLNGNPRTETAAFDSKFFTPEIRADIDYTYDFHHPKDDTIGGSSEIFRANEVQITQLGVGGDFHYDHVRARFMTQYGMYSTTTPRNDSSYSRGQWDLADAYRYLSEAYGGYHWDAMHGINVDAGIFVSYVGLFSYYNFDNWAYQPSYVSSNTPWFFTGVRAQFFVSDKLKIEPWFVNGWQSYGRFNNRPGIGGQILWRPTGKISILGNQYALGEDALGNPSRVRYHTDDSVQCKYLDRPEAKYISKAAFSLTGDAGCEHGGGVSCHGDSAKGPKQSFLGFMAYNRLWFDRNLFGLTIGGGKINNPGRYLVLLPPINGATATSGTPYFTENPGDKYKAWDASTTFDYMPSQYITWRLEYNHRVADVPYFSGPGGITPPDGNQGAPGSLVPGWTPDLRNSENRMTGAILVKF